MPRVIVSIAVIFVFAVFGKVIAYDNYQSKPIYVHYSDLTPYAQQQVDCLAENIYYEAKGESIKGWYGIAIVTLNRVNSDIFPKTICNVVTQKTKNRCQFSWWCLNNLRARAEKNIITKRDFELYKKIHTIALHAYCNYGRINDVTNGALFYHSNKVQKSSIGVTNLVHTATIGNHKFYALQQ